MCGIAGIFNQSATSAVDPGELQRTLDALRHRGPDANGVRVLGGGVGLAHTRLSILDLRPESNQPFSIDDDDYVIVFNGEIYNYIELREELEALGCRFRTRSDTEVLLRAYQRWGAAAVRRFNGMWAFAIYDRPRDVLFCSRDRFGVKPFNYAVHAGRFLFGSEIKAILAMAPELARPNYDSLILMLRETTGGQLADTWFAGVRRLAPAHNLTVSRTGLKVERYWDYPAEPLDGIGMPEAAERFRELLKDAVALRMRSDVPVGTTLSSGVDSSSIVCLLRTFYSGHHDTFTAQYPEARWDETETAERLARRLNMTPHLVPAFQGEFLENLRQIVWHLESPHPSPAVLPLWNIMKLARQTVTVVLEGQGADEELGGYIQTDLGHFVAELLRHGRVRDAVRELRLHVRSFPWRHTAAMAVRSATPAWVNESYQWLRRYGRVYRGPLAGRIRRPPARTDGWRRGDYLARLLRAQHAGGLVNLLHYGDAISMAHSLEARQPFLDYRLVEYCFRLPGELLIRDGHGKAILKEAVRADVPPEILNTRRKIGFFTPITEWFRQSPETTLYPVLRSQACRQRGLLDPREVEWAIDQHVSGRRDLSRPLYRWVGMELWFQRFIDGQSRER